METPRTLTSHFVMRPEGKDLVDLFREMERSVLEEFPDIEYSQGFASTGMYQPPERWPDVDLDGFDDEPPKSIEATAYVNEEQAEEGAFWQSRIRMRDAVGRGTRCFTAFTGLTEDVLRGQFDKLLAFYDRLATSFSIESGYAHDSDDMSLQNQESLYWFQIIKQPVPTEKVKYSDARHENIIDIEQNPAHRHIQKTITFGAAWTVFIGRDYLEVLPDARSRLRDIDAFQVVHLDDSLFRVTLFENPFDFASDESVRRMWNFRQTLKIDDVAHEFDPPL